MPASASADDEMIGVPFMAKEQQHNGESMFEDSPSYLVLKPRHDPDGGMLMARPDFMRKYSVANGYPAGEAMRLWKAAEERNPPLLETRYRLGYEKDINLPELLQTREPKHFLKPNATRCGNQMRSALSCCVPPLVGWVVFNSCWKQFEVPQGHVLPVENGEGGYLLAGEGVHSHCNPFWTLGRTPHDYSNGVLSHGDWALVVVDQGFIGLAMDKGQPVLLPPGFHQWKKTTLKFHKVIDLNNPVIYLGPYTLLTVDEGYAAVTQDNGRQEIKEGGMAHLLTHRNHKFEKFLSLKIQTDNLARIEVITADNVLMLTDATVNWRIMDPWLAAKNAAETMAGGGAKKQSDSITKLRNDVLKQASASLSSFIGTVNYSDSFSPNAQVQKAAASPVPGVPVQAAPTKQETAGVLFDVERMESAMAHSNRMTAKYGVEIISINIISAKPADPQLMNSLALGAVAAAEAQKLETAAQGKAKAVRIEADAMAAARLVETRAEAECTETMATADANAEETRARGAKNAAALLGESSIAVDLAKIEKTGRALGEKSSMFFGVDPASMGNIFSNPNLVSKKL
eukprot:TRINITY_DN219_c0_g1_i1.p1 TRINITY_DN219_c0_g1~~TRINITY_DN219_c0_g1_i1.p1  ORF type:complete len:572 (+),score=199.46 TRINITY_DN219_c0_g1_i1:96-1811(+)